MYKAKDSQVAILVYHLLSAPVDGSGQVLAMHTRHSTAYNLVSEFSVKGVAHEYAVT